MISRYMAGQSASAIDNARTLANTLGVPLLAVLVEGGQLTAEEAQARPEVSAADDLSDAEIARQVVRRLDGLLSRTGDHLRIAIGDRYIVAGPYSQDPVEMDPDEVVRIGRALVDGGTKRRDAGG